MSAYDRTILADGPVLFLGLGGAGTEVSPGGLPAEYHGSPGHTHLPNGEPATLFDGTSGQYVEVPDSEVLSVSTTGALTIEAWLRPDALVFPRTEGSGYVHWLGKLTYATVNQCEWVARIYSAGNTEGRANRVSGYAFNPPGGLGAGSYFQDPLRPGEWMHYALVITTAPDGPAQPPGRTKIYRDGRLRDTDALADYDIVPADTTSPLRIGSAALRSFFLGGIGKVAVYPRELPAERLAEHHAVMTSG
ncbi:MULTISPECIES: LamG domain-containing protein [Streptomyces]|uniref:LamG domain-containing protein n=1 Tax=Streptomyces glycanivorans TaxID=3033808 RepID=A0ABY9J4S0_9ACTN|nr:MULTISPECIES: LamG domain-containing protein [unclassified Streptomyces]WLQ62657.1 LamG domain-containing protein [Streptomyces sp. Alt3]WSQ76166.1 LamG domain-containing protein [Streptomyces sp. NBC_01213]